MLSRNTIIALLPLLTSANPVLNARASQSNTGEAYPIVLHAQGKASGSPIEDLAVTVSDGGFFINKLTLASACPVNAQCTLPTNVTAIFALDGATARMASKGSSQQIYVNGTNNALSYNPAHGTLASFSYTTSNGTPVNGTDLGAGFQYAPQTTSGPGRFTFDGSYDGDQYAVINAFWACPNGMQDHKQLWKIFVAAEQNGCVGIELFGMQYTQGVYAAWVY